MRTLPVVVLLFADCRGMELMMVPSSAPARILHEFSYRRNAAISAMLKSGQSWNTILKATGCSRSTLARLAKRLEEQRVEARAIRLEAKKAQLKGRAQ